MPERISHHPYLWLSTRLWMRGGRTRRPRTLAVIDPACCSGCRACVEVCPVDCIGEARLDSVGLSGPGHVCEVRLAECTGCSACRGICPWEAIAMVPIERVEQLCGVEQGSL